MLALAIEFSRCPRARTLKAEQCARSDRLPCPPRSSSPKGRTSCTGSEASAGRVVSAINLGASRIPIARPANRPQLRGIPDCQMLLRKEVIQPHLPVRLPCYDFTPIADPTFDGSLHKGWATGFGCYRLSWCDGRCVQGPGTYSLQRC